MRRNAHSKEVLLVLVSCLIFLTGCQKTNKIDHQENEITKVSRPSIMKILLNQKEKSEEIQKEDSSPTSPPPIIKEVPFSNPDLDITLKKFLNSEGFGFTNPEKGGYFFVPLQIRNNQFEYCIDQNLVQLDLATNKETIHKDFFEHLSVTAPMYTAGEWIIADQNRYFYAETTAEGESLICKEADTKEIIWKTRMFHRTAEYNIYTSNKMMQDDQNIYIAYDDNLTCYCLNKNSGKLLWTYDLKRSFPYLISSDSTWDESSKAAQSFFIKHLFSTGLVLFVSSHINKTNSQTPPKIEGDTIEMTISLSLDGKLMNILDSDALLCDNDHYLSIIGSKSLINNSIQWNLKEKMNEDVLIMKYHKKNYINGNPYIFQSGDHIFYIVKNEDVSSITVYQKLTGIEVWSQSIPGINLIAAWEQNNHINIFYEKASKGFLMVINLTLDQTLNIPIDLYRIPDNIMMECKIVQNQDRTNILFPEGVLSFTSQKGSYLPYLTNQESENFYITQNIEEPYFFENQRYIVVSHTPQEHTRGSSRGGSIIVLKKK